jgi:hypothetical protein
MAQYSQRGAEDAVRGVVFRELEPLARALLGDSVYNSVAARSGVPGGLGHVFYEQWRVLNPNSSAASSIAQQSRAYYDAVRRDNAY